MGGSDIKAVEECGGIATLKELYQIVPQIREIPPHLDAKHIIRAYLRRMSRVSGKLKRVGLGIYALPDVQLEENFFENIQKGKSREEIFGTIEETNMHACLEGMLLELGNIYGYLTYAADPSGVFNGKPLKTLATIEKFPHFTAPPLLNIAKTIDVIWFKKRAMVNMPKLTFDIELTTDITKALYRAYQLRDFKMFFYIVGPENKRKQFKRRIETDPYHEIRERVFFRSTDEIFSLYETAVKHFELKEKIIVEP